jgi:hypothetical protein
MSEENNQNQSIAASLNAWKDVEESMARAGSVGAQDLEAYLNWTRNLQKEFLEYSWYSYHQITKAAEEQLNLYLRVASTLPLFGLPPKGTETITGMVKEIVSETQKE